MERVAIYARLSRFDEKDDGEAGKNGGDAASIQRQIQSGRDMAKAKGWKVVEVYKDQNFSAFKDVFRPDYERMLADIAAGLIDVVIVWKLDRLVRNPREFERFWKVCEDAGASLVSVIDAVDMSTEFGAIVTRLLVGFARMESANIKVRTRAAQAERARNGKHHGGGIRPFGLTQDWAAEVPDEADLIRAAVRDILAGMSMRSITADWRARGITSARGRQWSQQTVRSMLLSPRLAGQRQHQGEVVATGEWPAIVSPEDHARLVALLTDPARTTSKGRAGRRYLLAGFLRCGSCGNRMASKSSGAKAGRRYRCSPDFDGGCGRTYVAAGPIEDLVSKAVLNALDDPAFMATVRAKARPETSPSLVAELRADEDSLARAADEHFVQRRLSAANYHRIRDQLETRIAKARRRLAEAAGHAVLADVQKPGDARLAWDARDVDWRRSLLSAVLSHVVVGAAVKGRRFDPERVQVVRR